MIKFIKYKIYRLKWFLSKYYVFKYPVHVDIEISSLCNIKCEFCPHSEEKTDFKKMFMDINLFKKVIDEIEGKVPSIKINLRGESTLHQNFIEIIEYVKGKFIDIRLNTNGQYPVTLNDKMAEVFTNISFSIDGYLKNTYLKIKKGASYDLMKSNVNYLLEKKANLTFSYVITKANEKELLAFKSNVKYRSGKIFVRHAMQRTKNNNYVMGDRSAVGRKNCYMPNRRLVVASNGDIYPCCVQWAKPFMVLGNVERRKIIDIWNSTYLSDLRNDLKSMNTENLPKSCRNCYSSESYIWKK